MRVTKIFKHPLRRGTKNRPIFTLEKSFGDPHSLDSDQEVSNSSVLNVLYRSEFLKEKRV